MDSGACHLVWISNVIKLKHTKTPWSDYRKLKVFRHPYHLEAHHGRLEICAAHRTNTGAWWGLCLCRKDMVWHLRLAGALYPKQSTRSLDTVSTHSITDVIGPWASVSVSRVHTLHLPSSRPISIEFMLLGAEFFFLFLNRWIFKSNYLQSFSIKVR